MKQILPYSPTTLIRYPFQHNEKSNCKEKQGDALKGGLLIPIIPNIFYKLNFCLFYFSPLPPSTTFVSAASTSAVKLYFFLIVSNMAGLAT